MFKKSARQEEDLSAFDSSKSAQNLSADDSIKKAFKKPKHIVPQQSISNISMINPVPAAIDEKADDEENQA